MTASTSYSILIPTKVVKDERGVFVATSPVLKGLIVVSKNKKELEETLIPQAIADLYLACGVHMIVTRIGADKKPDDQWVATPVEAIKAAEANQAAAA
jgi:hypothetical protein